MVKYMRYLLTYLDECELIHLLPVEADTEQEALQTLERVTTSQDYVPVGVRLAA